MALREGLQRTNKWRLQNALDVGCGTGEYLLPWCLTELETNTYAYRHVGNVGDGLPSMKSWH